MLVTLYLMKKMQDTNTCAISIYFQKLKPHKLISRSKVQSTTKSVFNFLTVRSLWFQPWRTPSTSWRYFLSAECTTFSPPWLWSATFLETTRAFRILEAFSSPLSMYLNYTPCITESDINSHLTYVTSILFFFRGRGVKSGIITDFLFFLSFIAEKLVPGIKKMKMMTTRKINTSRN